MKLLLVFVGGGLGAACRWLVGQAMASNGGFPVSTFTVNMIGCLLIGVFSVYLLNGMDRWFLFGIVGFLGGFTTFSSFGFDLMHMYKDGQQKLFWSYLISSNVFGILLVYIGHSLTNSLLK